LNYFEESSVWLEVSSEPECHLKGFKKKYIKFLYFFVIKNLGLVPDLDCIRIHQQAGSDLDLAKCQDLDGRIQ
jgi:hypothetical protein